MTDSVVDSIANEKLLVTIAIFAYNQEKYIAETVQAAFAQSYQPLEIIISDDCSSDRTFQIIEELSSVYKGPHHVRAIKQPENIGTLDHVLTVAKLSRGKLFVVNAGDDISYPNRVQELVFGWQQSGAMALSSQHDEISENGEYLRLNSSFPISQATQIIFGKSKIAKRTDGYVQSIPGFAAAYETDFLVGLPLNNKKILVEDGTLGAIINMMGGKIVRVSKSLMAYRILNSSYSVRQSSSSIKDILEREKKISRSCKSIIDGTDYILNYAEKSIPHAEKSVIDGLQKGVHYALIVRDFWKENFYGKMNRLLGVRTREEFSFIASRIFGIDFFAFLKRVQTKYQSQPIKTDS